jgi:hypothetical protein
MNHAHILKLLASFEKRLAVIVDDATESVTQAQRALDRLNRLRNDLNQLQARFLSSVETGVHAALDSQTPSD